MTVISALYLRARLIALDLWQLEPVRTVLAPVIFAAVVAGLLRAGVDGSLAGILATVVLGVLGFTAQEIARANVTPARRTVAATRAQVGAAINRAATELGPQLGPDSRKAVEVLAAQAQAYVGQHRAAE